MHELISNIISYSSETPLLFTQFRFWVFLGVVYMLFALITPVVKPHGRTSRFLPARLHMRNAYLFLASLLFYYKTSGIFLCILLFITCSDFFLAHQIHLCRTNGYRRFARFWLLVSILIDLSLLFYFKYAYFFTSIINDLMGTQLQVFDIFAYIGNIVTQSHRFRVDAILLPVGISFYIFQVISYTIDVYRGHVQPVRNIFDFGFYVSFFPQLVAGPILRASEFIPQLYHPFHLSRRWMGMGVFWILNGLGKKLILADYLAVNFIDRVFDNPILFSGFENLLALFGYSLQVYADFSGYTDIAIGIALLMGFYIPKNFDSPYKALNPQEFWRRWHMSLSRWLKAYVYIPLGGNRVTLLGKLFRRNEESSVSAFRKRWCGNINSFLTMLIGGLWHGASWNFVTWGALNGVGMIVYKWWAAINWHVRFLLIAFCCAVFNVLYHPDLLPPSMVDSLQSLIDGLIAGLSSEADTTLPVHGATAAHAARANSSSLIPNTGIWPALINIGRVWFNILMVGTLVRYIWFLLSRGREKYMPHRNSHTSSSPLRNGGQRVLTFVTTASARVWAIAQTFTFITFTRLFFRTGSNLDPATANREAWDTAKAMIHQIGSAWNMQLIPLVLWEYRLVVALFLTGMFIHWLPERWKRYYRYTFAILPLPIMLVVVVLVILVLYQFVTADLQPFIYFQF
ncbi:MAG: MBOAT family protein [Paludibacteraceae bacterium]|nr:MBOAT family protein [Paludibacteraceae bacterium]